MSLNNYVKKRELGAGSFGSACLYETKSNKENVVIKEVDLRKMNYGDKENARKETALLSQMNHGNIVKYFESFEENGKLFIVMEYCDAGDLQKKISCQRGGELFPEDKILDWIVQICLGIKHIHDRKILHRDIKTQNIFLTSNDRLKIGDFGVAKALSSTMALARTCIGTPYYLSPEVYNRTAYNNKCDIWSLGCVIYETCALDFPFKANNFNILKNKVTRQDYAPLPSFFSYELRHLISLMLKKDPNQRPNISAILRKPVLNNRIGKFLSEREKENEFSHTVLHGRVVQNKVVKPKTPVANNKRPSSAQSAVTPAKLVRPVSRPAENRRIQPVNVRLNEAARRRNELQKNIEAERKKKELEEKNRQLQEKNMLAKINRDREFGWQSVLSSDEKNESPRVPDPYKPQYMNPAFPSPRPNSANKNSNNRLASPRVPPATPQTPDKYDNYNAELDKHEQERQLRAKNFEYHDNKEKYVEAPVVKPSVGILPGMVAAHESANKAYHAAGQARLVEEYLERKAIAARIKAQAWGGGGFGAANLVPEATPLNQKEKDYQDRLEQIRMQNFYERRGLINMAAEKMDQKNIPRDVDSPRDPNNANNEMEERKRKILDLKRQAEERSRILKDQLEQKRQIAYESERKKFEMKRQEKALPVECDPPQENDNSSVPQLIQGPGVSICLKQLHNTPPKPLTPHTSVEDSEMKKIKGDILKRVNDKYSDGRGKWNVQSPDNKGDQPANAFDFLRQRDLEITSNQMEKTEVINNDDEPAVVVHMREEDVSKEKPSWFRPRNSFLQRLGELPVEHDRVTSICPDGDGDRMTSICQDGDGDRMTSICLDGDGDRMTSICQDGDGNKAVDVENQLNETIERETDADFPSPQGLGNNTINIKPPILRPALSAMLTPPELLEGEPTPHVVSSSPQLSKIMEASQETNTSRIQTTENKDDVLLTGTSEDVESILDDALIHSPILANIQQKKDTETPQSKLLHKPDTVPVVSQNRPVEISIQGGGKLFKTFEIVEEEDASTVDKIDNKEDLVVDDIEEDSNSDIDMNNSVKEQKPKDTVVAEVKPSDDEDTHHDAISSLKEYLTTGKFDSGSTSMLRTCSMPDLNLLLKNEEPSVSKYSNRLRSQSSSVCSVHDNEDMDLIDDDSDIDREEDEDVAEVRESMQHILQLSGSSEELGDTVQQLQREYEDADNEEEEEEEDNGEDDNDIGDADEDFGDESPNQEDIFLFIESERKELENLLGFDLLMQAYQYIENETDDDPNSISENDSSEVAVKEMLGPDKAHLYNRISSLVAISDSY